MKPVLLMSLILAAGAPLSAWSQSEPLLKGSDINSAKLVEALTPAAPAAAAAAPGASSEPGAAPGVLTRSFRVVKQAAPPAERPKPASASMLITFMTNSDELTPEAKQGLDALGTALKSDRLANFKFAIEGHADPRGGDEFNLKLSQRRAESVVQYLADKQGVERARLQPIGKGQSELLNRADPSAPENRRVTVKTLVQ